MITVNTLNPLTDVRWESFLQTQADACLFHSTAWLQALHQSYGYQPIVYTHADQQQDLQDGIVLAHVQSKITGKRLVSMPFSDFCPPLAKQQNQLDSLLAKITQDSSQQQNRYVELRANQPLSLSKPFTQQTIFFWHRINLSDDIDEIYKKFHKSHVKRKIKRAEREKLSYQSGASLELLHIFYDLFLFNRRKHCVPPQPFHWFQNLLSQFGEAMQIQVVYADKKAVAAIITFNYGHTCYYKYGCSDPSYTRLGSNALLFWRAIQAAKTANLTYFDMGRSDIDAAGFNLIKFKENWGATRDAVIYWRATLNDPQATESVDLCLPDSAVADVQSLPRQLARSLFSWLPDSLLVLSGRLLYRHMG